MEGRLGRAPLAAILRAVRRIQSRVGLISSLTIRFLMLQHFQIPAQHSSRLSTQCPTIRQIPILLHSALLLCNMIRFIVRNSWVYMPFP